MGGLLKENGGLGNATGQRVWPLESNSLCGEARRRTGLEDFGDCEIEGRLSVLTTSIEREANLHLLGRFLARMHILDLLETRLQLTDLWKSKTDDIKCIQRPIFITGMPRSGSTLLHELLMQDIDNRMPLVWEVMFPFPLRKGKGTDARRRIRKTAVRLWWFRRLAPGADAVHPMRATTPHECVAIHSYTLLSQEFTTIFRIAGYEAFLDTADLTPAYEWEKRFLQHLQLPGSTRRWVLKAPDHVFSLEALFRVFPDAIIIQMHRNPLDVLKSSIRLTKVLRGMFARPDKENQAGAREARLLAEGADRMTGFRDSHPELSGRFLDVNYTELISDPLGTIRRLYGQLELPLTNSVAARVTMLAAYRCRYARPRTNQTLTDDPGFDPRIESRRFTSYCARFGIQQT